MAELRRNSFRIPEGVDRVLSVRPRWMGGLHVPQAGYMVVRIWHDGRVEDVAGDRPDSGAGACQDTGAGGANRVPASTG